MRRIWYLLLFLIVFSWFLDKPEVAEAASIADSAREKESCAEVNELLTYILEENMTPLIERLNTEVFASEDQLETEITLFREAHCLDLPEERTELNMLDMYQTMLDYGKK